MAKSESRTRIVVPLRLRFTLERKVFFDDERVNLDIGIKKKEIKMRGENNLNLFNDVRTQNLNSKYIQINSNKIIYNIFAESLRNKI